jgi:hypothetical protein
VRFPVANITKVAFGGDDLRTAYATTARQKMSPLTWSVSPRRATSSPSGSTCPACWATPVVY